MPFLKFLAAWVFVSLLMSCGAGGGAGAASGEMGDIQDDGAVGGISEVPNPSPQMAKASGTPLETLQIGHSTYMLTCAQCHEYMLPENFFEDELEDAMPTMIKHAGLGQTEEDAVLDYLLAVKKVEGS
ncbi:hypothetical protein ACFQY0_17215 [Haloferula chungangensis]|uniref:Cytochrome c n=1 Tax=Haloferula chungangensis TaxID=1048331 RepID=A0ABW2LCP1_9BACT